MKTVFVKLIFLLILVVFVGCTARYLPVASGDVRVNEELAYVKNSDYFFSVERRNWYRQPEDINDYFTCFYVVVKNRSKEDMKVLKKDFYLIDEAEEIEETGSSEEAISPDRLETYFVPLANRMGSSEFGNEVESWNQQQENALAIRDNIFSYSFHFGILPAQTQREGYIFFPKLSNKNKKYSLKFKDKLIEFRKVEGRNKE